MSREVAAAVAVLRCYSGSPLVELERPDGTHESWAAHDSYGGSRAAHGPGGVVEDGQPGPADLAALSGIPSRARLEPGPRLSFDTDIPEPFARCIAQDLAAVLAATDPPDLPTALAEPATERLGTAPDRARRPGQRPGQRPDQRPDQWQRPAPAWPELPDLPAGSIADEFWLRVAEFADRPAVVDDDGVEVTYAELGRRVASLVALLGARPGERVGLLLDHGAGTVAAILATLTAGAAYVPLDPRYPMPRLLAMAGHARLGAILSSAAHLPLAAGLAGGAQVLDVAAAAPVGRPDPPDLPPVDPGAPAYILYTSGSTGLPKGVVQTHRNALHQVRLHRTNLRLTPDDRLSVVSSFGFDMAVTDTFAALLTGGCCVPVDVRELGLNGLAGALRRHRVSIYHSTPTVFRYLADCVDSQLPDLRAVVLGGEPVTGEDLDRCRRVAAPAAVMVNGYGATEISFAVQNHLPVATSTAGAVVPIGVPLAGVRVGLLGPDGSPSAVVGEIAISSEFLAGYWENPAESARFDLDHRGVRRYRTGDLGRRLPDGTLEYLGRRDRQVKIRGYRVEPAEVEHELRALAGVTHAAVLADGEQLRAFVVSSLDPAAVRQALARRLPEYLVPATVTPVAGLPLTPTGKVDSRALLALAPAPPPVAASGGLEGLIAATWAEALGREIGRHDRFFDVGAHSLVAAKVHHRLVERLGRRFPLTDLYAHPTVAGLAGHLDGAQRSTTAEQAAQRMARRRAARGR